MIKYYHQNVSYTKDIIHEDHKITENLREAPPLTTIDIEVFTKQKLLPGLIDKNNQPLDIYKLIALINASDIKLLHLLILSNAQLTAGEIFRDIRRWDYLLKISMTNSYDIAEYDSTSSPIRSLSSSQPLKELIKSGVIVQTNNKTTIMGDGRIVSHIPLYSLNFEYANEILTIAWTIALLKEFELDDFLAIITSQRGYYKNYDFALARIKLLTNVAYLYDLDPNVQLELSGDDIFELSEYKLNENDIIKRKSIKKSLMEPLIEAGLIKPKRTKHMYTLNPSSTIVPVSKSIIDMLSFLKSKYENESFTYEQIISALKLFYEGKYLYHTAFEIINKYLIQLPEKDISAKLINGEIYYVLTEKGIKNIIIFNKALSNPLEFLEINNVSDLGRVKPSNSNQSSTILNLDQLIPQLKGVFARLYLKVAQKASSAYYSLSSDTPKEG